MEREENKAMLVTGKQRVSINPKSKKGLHIKERWEWGMKGGLYRKGEG